mgnify:CR=1 FL=1
MTPRRLHNECNDCGFSDPYRCWPGRDLLGETLQALQEVRVLTDVFPGGQINIAEPMMGIQYIVNESGDPTAVVVPIDEWRRLLEEVQDALGI